MSVRFDLSGIAGNDLEFAFALMADGSPLSLAGLTLGVYLKASAVSPDAIAVVFTASSGLTITDSAGGLFTWAIPRADVPMIAAPGSLWYRVDLTDSSSRIETAMFGALVLTAA